MVCLLEAFFAVVVFLETFLDGIRRGSVFVNEIVGWKNLASGFYRDRVGDEF